MYKGMGNTRKKTAGGKNGRKGRDFRVGVTTLAEGSNLIKSCAWEDVTRATTPIHRTGDVHEKT